MGINYVVMIISCNLIDMTDFCRRSMKAWWFSPDLDLTPWVYQVRLAVKLHKWWPKVCIVDVQWHNFSFTFKELKFVVPCWNHALLHCELRHKTKWLLRQFCCFVASGRQTDLKADKNFCAKPFPICSQDVNEAITRHTWLQVQACSSYAQASTWNHLCQWPKELASWFLHLKRHFFRGPSSGTMLKLLVLCAIM